MRQALRLGRCLEVADHGQDRADAAALLGEALFELGAVRTLLPGFDELDVLAKQVVDELGELQAAFAGALGEVALYLFLEVHRQGQFGVWAVELAAHAFAEIVFVLHRVHPWPLARRLLVVLAFVPSGLARGDDAHGGARCARFHEGVDHDQQFTVLAKSHRCPALFDLAVFAVVDSEREGVPKDRCSTLEGDAVLGKALGRLGRVPLEGIDEVLGHCRASHFKRITIDKSSHGSARNMLLIVRVRPKMRL